MKASDPLNETTGIGPLARRDLFEQLVDQVNQSIEEGCELTFGNVPDPKNLTGNLFSPIILENIPEGSSPYTQEFFGPVFNLFKVANSDEAIKLANSSNWGLGGAVIGSDLDQAEKVALDIETGMVFVNDFTKSDWRLPYGGVKNSGFGRECAAEGIREFTNIKPIWIKE
jgi:succinate-semialdehyde dehydrogenase/glutarate-semialdehyde dehydrogenase